MTDIINMTTITDSSELCLRTWQSVCAALENEPGVASGTMMRRPALLAAEKTFVFLARLHGPGMGARIGDTSPQSLGLADWRPLQPFRDKAPMKGWILVGPSDHAQWLHVARTALAFRRAEVDGREVNHA